MKKFTVLFSMIFIFDGLSAFSMEKNFDGKIGGAYAIHPDRIGLNLEADYLWGLDPFFYAGFETGLFWVNWEEKRGEKLVGGTVADVKAQTNAYVIPMLGIAQLRLPNLRDKIGVLPYVSVGLGMSLMPISYSDPSYTDTSGIIHSKQTLNQLYAGFSWKAVVGSSFAFSGSKIEFIGEVGFAGAYMQHGNDDMNMSRMILNVGVRFPFDK